LTLLNRIVIVFHLLFKHRLDVKRKKGLFVLFVGEPSESSVFLVNFEEFIGRGDITYTKLLEKSDESFALKNGLVCVGTKFVLIILFTVVPHGFELLFVIVKDGYD
jgi:hypothetical protein